MAQFQCENLNACDDWDFTLRCRLNWSNNVNEEWDAPNISWLQEIGRVMV